MENLKKSAKEPKVKKVKKVAVAEDKSLENDELEENNRDDGAEKSSKTASKPKMKGSKETSAPKIASQSTTLNPVESILRAAQGQIGGSGDSTSDRDDEPVIVVKKKLGKKAADSSSQTSKQPTITKSVDVPAEIAAAKENTKPSSIMNGGRIGLFSKKDSVFGSTGSAPKLGGLLDGFLKRPKAAVSVASTNPDEAAESQASTIAAIESSSDLLPKIPKKYLDQRRLELLLK
jgi:hypothetical protein